MLENGRMARLHIVDMTSGSIMATTTVLQQNLLYLGIFCLHFICSFLTIPTLCLFFSSFDHDKMRSISIEYLLRSGIKIYTSCKEKKDISSFNIIVKTWKQFIAL